MSDTVPAADGAAQTQGVIPVPLPTRRPRVREVSSRFMSSSSSSSSSSSLNTPGVGVGVGGGGGDLHIFPPIKSPKHIGGGLSTPSPAQFQAKQQQQQQRSKTDHHHHHHHETVIRRSYSDSSPLGSHNYNKVPPPSHSKQRGAAVVKLFKENNSVAGGGKTEQQQQQQQLSDVDDAVVVLQQSKKPSSTSAIAKSSSSRPDTPIDRIIPSRFRQLSSTIYSHNFHRSQTNNSIPTSAAAKLLLSLSANSGLVNPCLAGDAKATSSSDGLSSEEEEEEGCSMRCPNSPLSIQNNLRTWSLHPDMRSSMPDSRLLVAETSCSSTTATNNVNDSHLNTKFFTASPCSRSLNLPLSNSVKMIGGSLSLPPPHPPCTKLGAAADAAARKGRKVFTHLEQVHSLKLLHGHYLQWSFANAKAEASLRAQTRDTERKLHSLRVKISDLTDAVKRKRVELGLLQRTKTLSTIVETHMPYLDEWSALEEEYSTSFSGTTHALVNSLVRLPVSGNVQADVREVGEALNSAIKLMEMIGTHVQRFMPKANEMDTLISELARSVGGERVLIEECGDLLLKTYKSQVEDCSLRGHLMQLKYNHIQLNA